ncbi:glycosyltransferase [Thermococcus sp.]|uniref:glycosyltransferase n=1 Tax=Thermococcus sp. TaxID=35749 RepID=UPI00263692E5|nr:glycosyltransferase family 1 protein [Thermococcus sp.]
MTGGEAMKVCLIARYFNLKNGGIGRYSLEILKGLKQKGVHVVPISEDNMPLPVVDIPSLVFVRYVLYYTFYVPISTPKNCSIYHITHLPESTNINFKNKNIIITVHDLIPMYFKKSNNVHEVLSRLFIQKTFIKTLKKIENAGNNVKIISVSHQTRDEILSLVNIDPERITVIPNGIPDYLSPCKKSNPIPRVGTLSYLGPRKRIDLLIKAYKESSHKGELWIGGTTQNKSYKNYLTSLVGEDSRVKFLGFIPESSILNFFTNIDVFVFPSKIEGYGLPIVEALACGKPVITLEDARIPIEVKEHTYVISKEDLPAVLEDPPQKIRKRDIKWAQEHKWSKVVDKVMGVYKQTMEESRLIPAPKGEVFKRRR